MATPLVTFDLDGVLMDGPFRRGVFPCVQGLLAPLVAEREGCDQVTAARRVLYDLLWESYTRHRDGAIAAAYDWDDIVATVAIRLEYQRPIRVQALVERFCHPGWIATRPGAHRTVRRLHSQGCRVVAVTNGYSQYQVPVLKALGLYPWLDGIVTPVEAGVAKPDPAIFAQAGGGRRRKATGQAIHIGDSLVHDMLGARRAGFTPVWITERLPESLRSLLPLERPGAPGFAGFLREELERDSVDKPLRAISAAACMPAAVVAELDEVPPLVDELLTEPAER